MSPSLGHPQRKLPNHHQNQFNLYTIPTSTRHRAFHSQSHPSSHPKSARFTFPSLLKNCAARVDLSHGKRTHTTILQLGLQFEPYISSALINMYFKCGSPADAAHVFDQLHQRDATLWNSMVSGYFRLGDHHRGLSLFFQMRSSGMKPDGHSLTILLGACGNSHLHFEQGEQVHAYAVRSGLDVDPFVGTALIDMYSKGGMAAEALRVFSVAVERSVLMWNAMISGFSHNGMWEKSLELFAIMRKGGFELQSMALSGALTACSIGCAVGFGEGVHCSAIKVGLELDAYVSTSLVAMYAKCGLVDEARRVFVGAPDKGVELWNSMLSAYVGNARPCKALEVYNQMRSGNVPVDPVTISHVLSACTMAGLWDFGRQIHGLLLKVPALGSMAVWSSLVTIYMKTGSTENAGVVFSSMGDRDVIVWGSMIAGFCHNSKFDQCLGLFHQMREEGLVPDSAIIAVLASACTGLECLHLGSQIHGHAVKCGASSDTFVGSALIDMYSKLGSPLSAAAVFSEMPRKNMVAWNSMISGYGRNGLTDESISTLIELSRQHLGPDSISMASAVASVSSSAALMKGKMLHGYQLRSGIITDVVVENALLDMYIKCGCLSYSRRIFRRMHFKNVASWNTMISGYGSHGCCEKAIELFEEMKRSECSPDDTTFLSLLSACSHSGSVEQGREIFESMRRDFDIAPRMEHHANLVDLLGRAGCLDEAYRFIKAMQIEPNESVWMCLLSACRSHRNSLFGEVAAEELLKLQPQGSGCYAQVLNFYVEMGLLDKAASLRAQMREAGVKKSPGCSWIEVRESVEVFYSGDSSSSQSVEIYDALRDLRRCMRDVDDVSTPDEKLEVFL